MRKNNSFSTSQLVLLGLMTAVLLLMAYTPLGYLHIGIFEITFNVIPVAISAIALGPFGGAVAGSVFGLTSFFQCIGIGGTSVLGATLFNINPFFTFILCFLPRFLDGYLLGFIFRLARSRVHSAAACALTGFCSAFLNTLFFMSCLVLLFGRTAYVQEMMGGKNVIAFILAFTGVNALLEIAVSSFVTAAVGTALLRARFLPVQKRANA